MTRLRVLHLEDTVSDRDLTRLQLERAAPGGFAITPAETFEDAVRLLGAGRYDVVLADLNLADSKGVATIERLLAAGCKVPVIAFTGDLDASRGLEALKAGAGDFVTKGTVDGATLANRIRFAVKRGAGGVPAERLESLVLERTAALDAALKTLRRRNEELQDQQRRFEVFSANAPYCSFLQDAKTGRVVFVSAAYERLFERSAAALAVDPWDWVNALVPEDAAEVRRAMSLPPAEPPDRTDAEYRVATKAGPVRWVRVSSMPVRDGSGVVVHHAGIAQDVTAERAAAALRKASDEQAQELVVSRRNNAFKAQFLNMAAHDLATPITPLRLQVALLQMKAGQLGDAGLQQMATLLDRNLVRLTGLIQDVLEVGRIEAGRIALRPRRVDLAATVQEAISTMQAAADQARVTLDAELPGMEAVADPDRVAQIALNLLSNAVKFTPAGGHVRTRLRMEGTRAVVEVEDDGRGIAKDDLEKLFQPFMRVGDTAAVPGTGLGLYISRGLARAMGGDLTGESRGEGRGSHFTLSLPVTAAAGHPVAAATA